MKIGVAVGRFQTPKLTAGHMALMSKVLDSNDQLIVVIGVSKTLGTNINPLDYLTREKMIRANYPKAIIFPLEDQSSDTVWSDNLDKLLSVFNFGNDITLYCGRDGFKSRYSGVHVAVEVPFTNCKSGTEMRHEAADSISNTENFRRGVIYSAINRYPHVFPTVDCALIYTDPNTNEKSLVLAKKPNEDLYRFIGGFVDRNETLEQAVVREVKEEASCDITNVRYLRSYPVNDWRYRNSKDSILTSFFVADYWMGPISAHDDIAVLEKIPFKSIVEKTFNVLDIMPEHRNLFILFCDNILKSQIKVVNSTGSETTEIKLSSGNIAEVNVSTVDVVYDYSEYLDPNYVDKIMNETEGIKVQD